MAGTVTHGAVSSQMQWSRARRYAVSRQHIIGGSEKNHVQHKVERKTGGMQLEEREKPW